MSIARFIDQARRRAPELVTGVLDWQLENAVVLFLAHGYAATHYRRQELLARAERKKVRAGWFRLRAMTHRKLRDRYKRLAQAQDKAEQCKGVWSCLE